ncbi:hypothetical protein CcaverHIS002_0508040 [Cutaneotrichosporon cavernicola]|uniref:GST N-terminal domain-containing protein n=1 Tax=Cutaneotrichosporon cavernicola TaxID=279322 RepID=A0AA48L765_9TREE|nr:uncharacterized protein CcaverHIS019_0508620 [Cutaneotrichosporon cavernicola]BEI85403.1 hypothetical protein CcaverHIS002_0508040 [Cutaneotrichosporon cavernicola]BEI93234.1 hypothetical protein CcaverHIS019_0508620 [Cutaneotrichosporon cavernicola]BEJ01011.1 hypothetical protein CcaverHIS631_0508680 [Cutaneotrichosporon cavernicola]BEJ08778.1 hypothetical protein CcaverHIS641_0508720 [Cutaneotrichosporon cavernicola]
MTNSVTLYGLSTRKGSATNVSPYAWKTAIDLGLLGIPFTWDGKTFEEIRTSFEKETGIPGILVPAIKDGQDWIYDSFKIALHLDTKQGKKALFPEGEEEARKMDEWADTELRNALVPLLVPWAWFLKVKLGGNQAAIDAMCNAVQDKAHVETQANNLRSKLSVIEERLQNGPFLSGDKAGHADASVWGWYATSRAINIPGFDVDLVWKHDSLPRVAAWVDAVQNAAGVELPR